MPNEDVGPEGFCTWLSRQQAEQRREEAVVWARAFFEPIDSESTDYGGGGAVIRVGERKILQLASLGLF